MTIGKGQPWGSTFEGPPPSLRAVDDAHLAALAAENRGEQTMPVIAAVGPGDVAATIGVAPTGQSHPEAQPHAYPMDLGLVALDDRTGGREQTIPFVAHVIVRRTGRRWLSPWPELIVMNTPLAAGLRLGPRAHPNDGRLDVTTGSLPWRQGREALRRAISGSHLPHPALDHRRVSEVEFDPGHRFDVAVDGVQVGRWRRLTISLIPDAFTLVAGLD